MGRRKLELKRIEDKSSRQVTFSKRRGGLMKKARQLSELCDVQIAVVIFSSGGRLYEFCSHNESISKLLQRYRLYTEGGASTDGLKKDNLQCAYSTIQKSAELVQTVQRCLDSPNADEISVENWMQLEEQLNAALLHTRATKTQLLISSMMDLQQQEKLFKEENELWQTKIAELQHNDDNPHEMNISFDNLVNRHLIPSTQVETLPLLR